MVILIEDRVDWESEVQTLPARSFPGQLNIMKVKDTSRRLY